MWNKIKENPNLKTSEIIKKLRKQFSVYVYDEENVDKNFPAPKKATIRTFEPNIEADKNLKNLSADDLKEKGIDCVTLRERLIMELQYFKETGKHLDIENITLCAGSRDSDGSVPCVDWRSFYGELYVGGDSPSYWFEVLRSRAVVSPSTSKLESLPEILEINGVKYTRK